MEKAIAHHIGTIRDIIFERRNEQSYIHMGGRSQLRGTET